MERLLLLNRIHALPRFGPTPGGRRFWKSVKGQQDSTSIIGCAGFVRVLTSRVECIPPPPDRAASCLSNDTVGLRLLTGAQVEGGGGIY